MGKFESSTSFTRRDFLKTSGKGVALGAAVLAAPAVVGRAPVTSAHAAFAGEPLITVSWAGNYEILFRETVIEPFNEKYGTLAETRGGWDQIVSQIESAPTDNPPFDLTVSDEYVASAGLSNGLYLKTDASKIPNLKAVYPWFYETRPAAAAAHGVPFAGGTCLLMLRKSLDIAPTDWKLLWDDRLSRKITLDRGAWWWTLSVPALISNAMPGLAEMYRYDTAESLMQELDKLKVARWFSDGAELANVLSQGEADAAFAYSSDAFTFVIEQPDEYVLGIPSQGVSAWADWYYKVRGTHHDELADLFLNYLLEKETQNRFLAKSMMFMARTDVTVPSHWGGYPRSNEDYHKMFQVITMDGWTTILADYQKYDDRFKKVVENTTK
ncbi:PotD/PotF family extracellular solute-binding protein [Mesorhizobium qingshengii]|jgi:spermidine/putrescine transport system substrate-binding protein|uniref:PotD/PotF family extracellular solute-binding protein n=1 Tax=Mesorhizobium qingshengii TaxID=1165689 RepID=A0ABT4R3E4_9HYPH|nr:PotD/PotF family extracellular solute-binding protein [Mesorhizobium qingshengii]MCZ8548357.1 PotD/PotF family extracellular solute-binding protein [Mesorhizobium qingshengii]